MQLTFENKFIFRNLFFYNSQQTLYFLTYSRLWLVFGIITCTSFLFYEYKSKRTKADYIALLCTHNQKNYNLNKKKLCEGFVAYHFGIVEIKWTTDLSNSQKLINACFITTLKTFTVFSPFLFSFKFRKFVYYFFFK
jgi:hypothetical protein